MERKEIDRLSMMDMLALCSMNIEPVRIFARLAFLHTLSVSPIQFLEGLFILVSLLINSHQDSAIENSIFRSINAG